MEVCEENRGVVVVVAEEEKSREGGGVLMAKIGAEEVIPTNMVKEGDSAKEEAHPYAFHVSGPRNVAAPNWRDLINSSWSVD